MTLIYTLALLCAVIPLADRMQGRSPFWAQVFEVLVALDRLVNACIAGSASETLSSRAHRMREKGQPAWGWTADAIDALFFWQDGHCRQSFEWETARLANPPWGTPAAPAEAAPTAQPYMPPGVDPDNS